MRCWKSPGGWSVVGEVKRQVGPGEVSHRWSLGFISLTGKGGWGILSR